jgi:hypothetical protein
VTFWGLSSTGWSAFTAIGTFLLAVSSVVVVGWTNRRDNRLRMRERDERADLEAGQVAVDVQPFVPPPASGPTHRVTVSAPRSLPRPLRVEGQVCNDGLNRTIVAFDPPKPREAVTTDAYDYIFDVTVGDGTPVIRFTDWNGNRYYNYKGYTARIASDWVYAIGRIEWLLGASATGHPPSGKPPWLRRRRRS